jgi:hypothetical protein
MQQLKEPIETVHLYVVREEEHEKQPYFFFPLLLAVVCVLSITAVTVYSGEHPFYEQETMRVPAKLLPLQTFSATEPIIPTGIKTYPATTAHGLLTITNGSVLWEHLPSGMIFTTSNGIEVMTTEAVDVPAGNGASYGVAFVPATAVMTGTQGNIQALSIDQVYGTSLYIRNDQPFTGGDEFSSVAVITPQDRLRALVEARASLIEHTLDGMLYRPCSEKTTGVQTVQVSWTCQFTTYAPVAGKVVSAQVQGTDIVLDVVYVARPRMYYGK